MYGVYRGDYLRGRYRGDPGVLDLLRKGVGVVGGIASKILPAPFGTIAKVATGVITGRPQPSAVMPAMPSMPAMPRLPMMPSAVAASVTQEGVPRRIRKDGKPYKRPTMNVANPKALRRSIRRQAGFVKLARRALRGTGYAITTTRGRSRRSVTVHEAGPGSVHLRG